MIFISISLTILALTGGMFLLAKSNKDNLGIFFKIIAYFIIIASFLNLAGSTIHCAMKFYHKEYLNNEIRMRDNFINRMKFYQDMHDDGFGDWKRNHDENDWNQRRERFDGYWKKEKETSDSSNYKK